MTKLLSILALAGFLMIGGISTASAHCGNCPGDHAKAGKAQVCEKCVKAGKPCKCGGKKSGKMKPCEKTLNKHNGKHTAKHRAAGNNKGSLVLRSGQSFSSSYNN